MNYRIITDRFELEKLAEDIFLSNNTSIVCMDYADLVAVRRMGTFKQGISIECTQTEFSNGVLSAIAESKLPAFQVSSFVLTVVAKQSVIHSVDIQALSDLIQTVSGLGTSENRLGGIYSVSSSTNMEQDIVVNILLSAVKSATDKEEDDRVESWLEKYRAEHLKEPMGNLSDFFVNE